MKVMMKKNQDKKTNNEIIEKLKKNKRKQTFTQEMFKNNKINKKENTEQIKIKIKKEKIKDKEKNKNSISRKEFSNDFKYININEGKNKNKIKVKPENLLIKERSNSFHLENSKFENDIEGEKIRNDSTINNSVKEAKIKKPLGKKMSNFEHELQKYKKKMQFNLLSKDKFTNTEFSDSDYLKYTLNCCDLILDINLEKQSRLKNKVNFNFKNSKKKKIEKKIALFDLDETIVHCTGDIRTTKEKYQNVIEIKLPGKQEIQVGINVRPYWKETFKLIKKYYHIVIYTASHQAYADAVLDFMDPKNKFFKHRLYRNNCSLIDVDGAKFYVKDLEILNENYNLKDIVIVDNSVLSFAYHLHNGIPIVPYYDEDKDGSLYVVGLYLMHIFKQNDLREENKKYINLDSFLEEAKKLKEDSFEEYDENSIESFKEIDENNNSINNNDNNKSLENPIERKSILIKRNSAKKNSEKKVFFNIQKKNSISNFSACIQREKTQVFGFQKLKTKSKLLNMYLEVNDDSPKSEHFQSKPKNIFFDKKASLKKLEVNNKIKDEKYENDNKETKIVFVDNDEEDIDCKSDNVFMDEQNLQNNDSKIKENEEALLKRGLTIGQDLINNFGFNKNNKKKNNILGFIRSNFYNKFKI